MNPNERLVTIRSKDALDTGLKNGFTVEFPNALHDIKSVRLVSTAIPNSIYNIDGVNDNIFIDVPDMGHVADEYFLPAGFYNINTLCTAVETLLNTNTPDGNFTVVYDDISAKVTISRSASTFELLFSLNVGKMLGFSADVPALSTSATSNLVVDMLPSGFFFHIDINLGHQSFDCIVPRNALMSTSVLSEKELISQCRTYTSFNSQKAIVNLYTEPKNEFRRTLANLNSNWEIILAIVSS